MAGASTGAFISLEGPDGSGKTSQARLLVEWLRDRGYEVHLTREPGGTEIGDQIREILHDPSNVAMNSRTEFLLYSASRAQHVSQRILPALALGRLVVSDRYADSSLAYQGYGRGLDLDVMRIITAFATRDLKPDITLYLDIAPGKGLQRRVLSGEEWNRMDAEELAFHRRVRAGFLTLAEAEPDRWKVVKADRPVEEIQADVRAMVSDYLGLSAD